MDLDGTLTNKDKVITPRTKQESDGSAEAGNQGSPGFRQADLRRSASGAGTGTGELWRLYPVVQWRHDHRTAAQGKSLEQELPVEANRRIVELAKKEQVDILTYQDTQILTNNPENRYAKLESRINHLKLKQVDNLEEYLDFAVPKFLMLDDGDYLALVEARVKAALGKNFSVYRSDPFFLEILPQSRQGPEPGTAVKAAWHGTEGMIACGDAYR